MTSRNHPFTDIPILPEATSDVIKFLGSPVDVIRRHRVSRMQHWLRRAHDLRHRSLALLRGVTDSSLRHFLLRDAAPADDPALGTFPHIALWGEVHKATQSKDTSIIQCLLEGFPLSGAIGLSGTWRPLVPQPVSYFAEDELPVRAWGIRQCIIRKLTCNCERQTEDLNKAVWDKTMSDVTEGFCTGPTSILNRSPTS